MSGEAQLGAIPLPIAAPQVKAGKVKAFAVSQDVIPSTGTPHEFAAFIRAEIAKWKNVIEISGAKVD
jgi:tripartite-type tricarboxylate transporter receptor subunit TctC